MVRFFNPLVFVPLAAFVLLAGCGKKEAPAAAGQSGSSSAPASSARSSANDYSKSALTEEKVAHFIDSMKEEHNPLEFIFKQGGMMRGVGEMKAKEAEFNAFANRYGFKDYTEYIDTWGRVMVGQMQLASAQMMSGLQDMMKKQAAQAEEKLKDAKLSADDRKTYADQLAEAQKSLKDMSKPDSSGLNAADLELVKKYNDQITAAGKKYKPQPGR